MTALDTNLELSFKETFLSVSFLVYVDPKAALFTTFGKLVEFKTGEFELPWLLSRIAEPLGLFSDLSFLILATKDLKSTSDLKISLFAVDAKSSF